MVIAMGARAWLARSERAEREARMRALQAASDETLRQVSREAEERARAAQQEELRRSVEALKAEGDRIRPPTLATASASARPLGSAEIAAQDEEARRALADWERTPHAMFVTWADLAVAPVQQAWGAEVRSAPARKALVARLEGVKGRLEKALGGRERFPDPAAVRAEIPEIDAALGEIDGALGAGPHRGMARENATQLRRMLAAAPER